MIFFSSRPPPNHCPTLACWISRWISQRPSCLVRLIVYFIISTGAAAARKQKCEASPRGAACVALLFCVVKWILPETQWPTPARVAPRILRDVIGRKQFPQSYLAAGNASLSLPLGNFGLCLWLNRLLFFLGHSIYSRGCEMSFHGQGVMGDIKLFCLFFVFFPHPCSMWWSPVHMVLAGSPAEAHSTGHTCKMDAFTLFIGNTDTPPGCLSLCVLYCERWKKDWKKNWIVQ